MSLHRLQIISSTDFLKIYPVPFRSNIPSSSDIFLKFLISGICLKNSQQKFIEAFDCSDNQKFTNSCDNYPGNPRSSFILRFWRHFSVPELAKRVKTTRKDFLQFSPPEISNNFHKF